MESLMTFGKLMTRSGASATGLAVSDSGLIYRGPDLVGWIVCRGQICRAGRLTVEYMEVGVSGTSHTYIVVRVGDEREVTIQKMRLSEEPMRAAIRIAGWR